MDERTIARIFSECDSDGDGRLTRDELKAGLRRLHIPTSSAAIDRFLAATDLDGDGCLSLAEFQAAVLLQQQRLRRAFLEMAGARARGDPHRITAADVERFAAKLGVALSHDEVKRLLAAMDTTGTGKQHVDMADFVQFFLTELSDVHSDGLFESWMRASAIAAIPIPDESTAGVPSWVTLLSGAIAGMTSRTLTAPADRLKTLLQVGVSGPPPAGAPTAAPATAASPPPRGAAVTQRWHMGHTTSPWPASRGLVSSIAFTVPHSHTGSNGWHRTGLGSAPAVWTSRPPPDVPRDMETGGASAAARTAQMGAVDVPMGLEATSGAG